ncbi:carboxypeptidase M32 [Paraflavisolibacter sp. H34]|uniref:carboxypeptidase M32 n=1 Tax=Huijunlia imazamoxiresistens TaxID=3127457 RepID=UPI003019A07F
MKNTRELYASYQLRLQRIADLRNANAVLQWDQETYLPPKGAALRGQQISTLSELAHQLFTEDSLGDLLQELAHRDDVSFPEKRNVELTLEDYNRNKKYSSAFVRQMSEQVNKTYHAWIEARRGNSFALFEKDLTALVELKKQETDILGYEHHPYNALLNEYEKGCTVELLDRTFGHILPDLKELTGRIAAKPQVDDTFLFQHFPRQQQWDWGMHLIKELNFNLDAGRQDVSEHPFSTSFNPGDVRITTRIDENDLGNMTWSCIHEVGHGLYEQGLPEDQYGLPLGEACSYSIHESQSRLWENNVGRSRTFWQHYLPQLKQYFPGQLAQVDLEQFYRGINRVQPSLIRTEADEITYHFHVYIRYQLEKSLIEGTLAAKDLPAFWNEQYKKLLDVQVPDDKRGCLQDVHWSHGSFGYFPTYSLGSFYAAQLYAAAQKSLPNLEQEIATGNSRSLLQWLRSGVHAKGRIRNSEELCREVTGETLNSAYFLQYLLDKYAGIY